MYDLFCTCLRGSFHIHHYSHFIPVHIVHNNLQACLHSYLKKIFLVVVLALCKRWRLGAVWCCYGWQAAASVLLDLQAPLMSKGIVLAALLILLSAEKRRGRKSKLPLDMSKQTKVCSLVHLKNASYSDFSEDIDVQCYHALYCSYWIKQFACSLEHWEAWKISKRSRHCDSWHSRKKRNLFYI